MLPCVTRYPGWVCLRVPSLQSTSVCMNYLRKTAWLQTTVCQYSPSTPQRTQGKEWVGFSHHFPFSHWMLPWSGLLFLVSPARDFCQLFRMPGHFPGCSVAMCDAAERSRHRAGRSIYTIIIHQKFSQDLRKLDRRRTYKYLLRYALSRSSPLHVWIGGGKLLSSIKYSSFYSRKLRILGRLSILYILLPICR